MDIQSIKEKIEKKKARIEQLTKDIKFLENKCVQLENEQIIKLVRQENITFSELDEFIKAAKKGRLTQYEKGIADKGTENSEYQSEGTYSGHTAGDYTAGKNQSDL